MFIQLKAWCLDEAQRTGVKIDAIRSRINRGNYPGLSLIRINARVIYVDTDSVPKNGFNLIRSTERGRKMICVEN